METDVFIWFVCPFNSPNVLGPHLGVLLFSNLLPPGTVGPEYVTDNVFCL